MAPVSINSKRFAGAELVKMLLPTIDNLRRALESAPQYDVPPDDAWQTLLAGVAATQRGLIDDLAKQGIRPIEPALCDPFDPSHHQALFEVEDSSCPPGTVAQVVQPGYEYHDRLLRPALVGVAKTGN